MKLYENTEKAFEKVSELALRLFVNSIVFVLVLICVSAWLGMIMLGDQDVAGKIRDCFIAFSFLAFFMVQRTLMKYNTAMHVKLNELVLAHENARNELVNVEKLSEKEIDELAHALHDHQAGGENEAAKKGTNTGLTGTKGAQK